MALVPDDNSTEDFRHGGVEGKPLVVLLWEQENFYHDGIEAIGLHCASFEEYEAKYWRLIGIWDTIYNASVMDRQEGKKHPMGFADQVVAFAQELMAELLRVEEVLGLD